MLAYPILSLFSYPKIIDIHNEIKLISKHVS